MDGFKDRKSRFHTSGYLFLFRYRFLQSLNGPLVISEDHRMVGNVLYSISGK